MSDSSLKMGTNRPDPCKFYSERSKSVWVLRTKDIGRGRKPKFIFWVGVCIHKQGIILSVPSVSSMKECPVQGKCPELNDFVDLNLVEADVERNIAIYCVPSSPSPARPFSFSKFSVDGGTRSGQHLISIIPTCFSNNPRSSGEPYSFFEGTVAFPSGNEPLAKNMKKLVMHGGYYPDVLNPHRTSLHLKSARHVSEEEEEEEEDENYLEDDEEDEYSEEDLSESNNKVPLHYNDGFLDDSEDEMESVLSKCSQDISLIHIVGLPGWSPNLCGSPIFDTAGKIVGLFAFMMLQSCYALTISELRKYCKKRKYGAFTIRLKRNKIKFTIRLKRNKIKFGKKNRIYVGKCGMKIRFLDYIMKFKKKSKGSRNVGRPKKKLRVQ